MLNLSLLFNCLISLRLIQVHGEHTHGDYGVNNSLLTPTKEHVAPSNEKHSLSLLTPTNTIMMVYSPGPPSRKIVLCKLNYCSVILQKNTKKIRIYNDARAWP